MARRVFFSFHYKADSLRAGQVRNMGTIEGDPAVTDNDWEAITRGGGDHHQEQLLAPRDATGGAAKPPQDAAKMP